MRTRQRRVVTSRHGVGVAIRLIAIGSVLAVGAWGWSTSGVDAGADLLKGGGSSELALHTGRLEPRQMTNPLSFVMTGSVRGLYPGATLPLRLTVFNITSSPITVTSISTNVVSLSRTCTTAELNVSNFSGRLPVAPHRDATLVVAVTLAHGAPNACQGNVFIFFYRGQATSS